MSAYSFPSLISDSSSFSRSSDLHESTHERLSPAFSAPTASGPLQHKSPENPEIYQLRTKVSKLVQDKFVLGDYAAELQSRIRQLQREKMEHQDLIEDKGDNGLVGQAGSTVSIVVPTRLNSPAPHGNKPNHSSLHRPSNICFETPETNPPPQPEPPVRPFDYHHEYMTPTRRRLQAMYGMFSSDRCPGSGEPSHHEAGSRNRDHASRADSIRISHSTPSTQISRDHGTKRTAFTSKLDSIVLTSKLFPLPSSRSKTPLAPLSPDRHSVTSHTAVIPLASCTSSTPHAGTIFLDSPPNKNVKVKLPRTGRILLSQSLGLEENRHLGVQSRSREGTPAPKSRGRVSFSDRLFMYSSDRGDETETDTEHSGKVWGSWSRKKRPPPLLFSKEKATASRPSTPPSDRPDDLEHRRRGKRRSLAAGCLRTLVSGSGDRDKAYSDDQRERRVLRRSHSETHRSGSCSRTHLDCRSTTNSRNHTRSEKRETDIENAGAVGKDEKRRISPSRVGSPMPKSRLPELQDCHELKRTSSMRSAGKWGQRGKGSSAELVRRRTIHPMFSFERPGSTETVSRSSSRRDGDIADGAGTSDRRCLAIDKSPKLPRQVVSAAPEAARLTPYEFEASHSQVTHTQDHSYTSGHTGGTVLTRSEPDSAPKVSMMRTRLGMQSHGTFAFEPAAAVVFSPRSASPVVGHSFIPGVNAARGSLSRKTSDNLPSSSAGSNWKTKCDPLKPPPTEPDIKTKGCEYIDFCKELKGLIGDGEEWSSFKKYVRRFDLEVLSAEVLLQRVKKLIDKHRSVDGATRLRLYEQFGMIVHDNLQE